MRIILFQTCKLIQIERRKSTQAFIISFAETTWHNYHVLPGKLPVTKLSCLSTKTRYNFECRLCQSCLLESGSILTVEVTA